MKCGGSRSGVRALVLDSANGPGNLTVSGPAECHRACGQAHARLRVRCPRRFVTGLLLLVGLVAHVPLPAEVAAYPMVECRVDGRRVELPGGDQPANHADHPWQVALQLDGHYIGGGVLLDAGWVLTAGHLVVDASATRLTVVYGEANPRDFARAERDAVEGVFVHPEFDSESVSPRNDIALLRLADPLPDVPRSYATLPPKRDVGGVERPGTCAVVTRWEAVSLEPPSLSSLRATNVPILSRRECRAAYGKGNSIPAGNICASEVAVTCQGSSGGSANGPRRLVGLVSWAEGTCGDPDAKPDVYTRVSRYRAWIQRTMRGNP